MSENNNKNPKIAIFHHFLLGHCKGGGEKLVFQLKEELGADLIIGSLDEKGWGKNQKNSDDFTKQLWKNPETVTILSTESNNKIIKYIKRQWVFLTSPKIKEIAKKYDYIIYSYGNIALAPQRIKRYNPKIKTLAYIHTPPRAFADQFEEKTKNFNFIKKSIAKIFQKLVMYNLREGLKTMDYIVTNSNNIKKRTKKYVGIEADDYIWPPTDTSNLKFIESGDFYHSHGRLEDAKRIKTIVNAFAKMPDQKLVITSSGPLKQWVENEIKTKNLTNITYEGRVSDQRRDELMGKCLAGIYIPVDEDAGITQYEFMACGKPVIGVAEGGLLESVEDGKTGYLIKENPTHKDLIDCISKIQKQDILKMKDNCVEAASLVTKEIFADRIRNKLKLL